MKKLIIIIMVLLTSIVNGQVIKVHVSEIYEFSHLAVIGTDKAIENNYLNLDSIGITDANYIFDFDSMKIYLENPLGQNAQRKLMMKEFGHNTFKTYFIDTPENNLIEVTCSKNVLCFRWSEVVNGMIYIKGWFANIPKKE